MATLVFSNIFDMNLEVPGERSIHERTAIYREGGNTKIDEGRLRDRGGILYEGEVNWSQEMED